MEGSSQPPVPVVANVQLPVQIASTCGSQYATTCTTCQYCSRKGNTYHSQNYISQKWLNNNGKTKWTYVKKHSARFWSWIARFATTVRQLTQKTGADTDNLQVKILECYSYIILLKSMLKDKDYSSGIEDNKEWLKLANSVQTTSSFLTKLLTFKGMNLFMIWIKEAISTSSRIVRTVLLYVWKHTKSLKLLDKAKRCCQSLIQ